MSETPQFGTAEYQPQLSGESCKTCGSPISGQYFLVNGVITCWECAQKTEASVPQDSHAAFSRGILFGIGGAIIGLILYSVVGIVTGLEIGYVSLAVGYIVGRALLLGTSGVGGRRHQIAAAMLTYAAVSMSAVPMYIWSMQQDRSVESAPSSAEITTVDAETEAEPAAETTSDPDDEPTAETASDPDAANESGPGLVGTLIFVAVLGLASPILGLMSPLNGLIGLVILFVGIRIAWTMTAGNAVEIVGPFNA